MKKTDQKVRTILFDWDGCLARTLDVWLRAYKRVFQEYGIALEDRTITQTVFGNWNAPVAFGIANIDEYNRKLVDEVHRGMNRFRLYPSVPFVLRRLERMGITLAIITSSKRHIVEPRLRAKNIHSYFTVVLTEEDVVKHKPDPEVVVSAMEKIKAHPDTTLIVGDTTHDIRAGKNAGIRTVLFYPTDHELFYPYDILVKQSPDYIIGHHRELLDIAR